MRVLHYALGFPPYRSGGLTKFCIDLMKQQKSMGYKVALIWPGQMKLLNKTVSVLDRNYFDGIQSFEVINPLPISYDEGIIEIEKFTESCEKNVFLNLFERFKPDVIHVHTLMGLHKEFLEVAKENGIKTVFSIHDFYPVCPKVTLFREGKVCEHLSNCSLCPQCNLTALSMSRVKLLQSPLYRKLKDSNIVKIMRRKHRNQYLSGKSSAIAERKKATRTHVDYQQLRKYYRLMIEMFDVIHANSEVTRNIYVKLFNLRNIKVISITHADIKDKRRIKKFSADKIKITYLGPGGEAKGFFLLKEALDELWKNDQNYFLHIFFDPIEITPYMIVHERYNYSDLERIFKSTDVLVAPSVWYETFGYTILEALSFGVPVIVSDYVGAKDVIPENCGIVIKNIDKYKLADVIRLLNVEDLKRMNERIVAECPITTLNAMSNEITLQCY